MAPKTISNGNVNNTFKKKLYQCLIKSKFEEKEGNKKYFEIPKDLDVDVEAVVDEDDENSSETTSSSSSFSSSSSSSSEEEYQDL